jgi:hypothetical protein
MPPVVDTRLLEIDSLDRALDHLFPTAVTITRTSDEDFQSRQLVVSLDAKHVAELL